jgi:hypothetical protein
VAVQSTQVIWSDPAGQAVSDRVCWHVPVLSQHPRQLLMLHAPPPLDEHVPLWHVPPLVVQSWHVAPPVPQCRLVGACTHVPLLQQPFAQFDALQVPPPEPPPELLPELPEPVLQAPALQVSPEFAQFAQMLPCVPHCMSDVFVTQTLPAQQPAHVVGPHEELASGAPASAAPPPELLELPKPLPLLPLDDDSVLPDELPLPLEEELPDDEPLLPDDPVDELWSEAPPWSPPSCEP